VAVFRSACRSFATVIVRVLIQTPGTFLQKVLSINAFQPSQPIIFAICAHFCPHFKKTFKKALDCPIIMWDTAPCCVGLLFDISAKPGPLSPRHSLIQALPVKRGVNVKVKPWSRPAAPSCRAKARATAEASAKAGRILFIIVILILIVPLPAFSKSRSVKISLKALQPPHIHNLSSFATPLASRRSQGESSQVKVVGQEVKSRRACHAKLVATAEASPKAGQVMSFSPCSAASARGLG